MICTILSKYYSFRQPFSPIWIYWYTREASTAMVVTNMTHIWTLVRRILGLRSFTGSSERNGDGEVAGVGRGGRRGMMRYQAEMGAVGEGGAAGAGAGAGQGIPQHSQSRNRLSVPYFADIGGLLPPARSPLSKSYSSSSFSRMQQKKHRLSSASATTTAAPPSPQPKRPLSWLGPTPSDQADGNNKNKIPTTPNGTISDHQQASSSPFPSPDLPLENNQLVRNPAACVENSLPRGRGRGRGLQRVDSITLLGLPDG
jgi:hypothetical protein